MEEDERMSYDKIIGELRLKEYPMLQGESPRTPSKYQSDP